MYIDYIYIHYYMYYILYIYILYSLLQLLSTKLCHPKPSENYSGPIITLSNPNKQPYGII